MNAKKTDAIRKALSSFYNISPSDIPGEFLSKMVFRRYKKGEYLIRTGEIERYFYFLIKGCALCYYTVADDERVVNIWDKVGTWISGMGSLQPMVTICDILIEVESELAQITIEDFRNISESYPILSRKYIETLYNENLVKCEEKMMLNQPNTYRYQWFLEHHPHGFETIDHYKIASFLGMSPVTLSRIRNKNNGK